MKYIRTKPFAATFFKANGGPATILASLPRNKYMFYANFVASAAAKGKYSEYKDLGTWQRGVSFKIHSIDKPKIELSTVELNQYNRRRHVYTKTEYQPFTVKMYDTADDKPLQLWIRYYNYYFADSRPKNSTAYKSSVVSAHLDVEGSTGWGLNPQYEDYNFFDRVELYAIFGKRYTQINYINPKIVNIDWSNYDSSSSDLGEASITMKYEAVEYVTSGARITPDLMNQFGFDITKSLEVQGVPPPVQAIDFWQPRSDFLGVLGRLGIPISPVEGILNGFQIANSTLNLFSQLPLGAFSQQAGEILGQTTQYVSAANTVNSLLTGQNPAFPSSFLGTNVAGAAMLTNQVGGVLRQFGSFNFGS